MRNSVAPASDYDGRVVKAASPVKTRLNHWAGDTSLVGVGVSSNPTQIFVITFVCLRSWWVRFKFNSLFAILCIDLYAC